MTKDSPLGVLQVQVDRIAKMLKIAERGELTGANDPGGKIAAARAANKDFKFAVVMDDKILSITMTWVSIREMTEVAIAAYIVAQMRETSDTETKH